MLTDVAFVPPDRDAKIPPLEVDERLTLVLALAVVGLP
jgi:hypothetical protein